MTQLSDNRNTLELATNRALVADVAIYAAEKMYAGGMIAIDSGGEMDMASDTLGLRVLGRCPKYVDNTADGEKSNIEHGVFRYENSSTYAITQKMIGQVCYVEDDNTVGAGSTNLVAAGIIKDVDSSGVWVDQSLEALAVSRALARTKVVSVTDTTYTALATQAFQGNVILACDNASGVVVTLPSAVAGYRLGVQRTAATAAHDVTLTAASGDTVRGSTAAGTAANTTDAVSGILYLECESATAWVDASPIAADRASWTPST
jgi:hypothetical protein